MKILIVIVLVDSATPYEAFKKLIGIDAILLVKGIPFFKIEEQYIIAEYQRPYFWNYENYFQLFGNIEKNLIEQSNKE